MRFELPAGGGVQVTVDARVAPGTAAGTVVENQARLRSVVQPEEPSDADGNDENGDGPTRFVVGGDGRPTISKEVLVVGGGTAEPGGRLEYRIRVANPGAVPISGLRVLDTLPAGTELVAGSALLDGFARGVSVTGATLSADYGATYGALQPGADFEFSFRVTLDDTLAEGTPIVNTAEVRWNACMSGCPTDSARVDVGGAPGTVTLRGRIWHDPDHDDRHDEGEQVFGGWPLAVYLDRPAPGPADAPIDRFTTSEDGRFAIVGLAPGGPYTVTFAVPEGSPGWPAGSNRALGRSAPAVGEAGLMRIAGIQAEAGRNVLDENLPLDPHGRLYNSVTRERFPAGARLWLRRQDGGPLPEACFDTPPHLGSQQGQISDGEAFYRFDLRPGADPACPVGGVYRLLVETPDGAGGWRENVSVVIPPEPTTLDPENCGADAVPATAECEVQPQPEAPASDVPPGPGTRYHLTVRYGDGERGPFNHHIPLDDVPAGLVTISKTTPLKNVVRGEAVPYTIEVSNPQDFNISGLIVRDTMPPGFKYLPGSARRDGLPFEPLGDGRRLDFPPFALAPGARSRIQLLLVVGAGVGEGEYVNLAQAFIAGLAEPVSGEASATVRVVPDPTFDCADIVGKVFDDRDLDGEPDPGEPGLAGVRLATARGLLVTTDAHGRFHIACAQVPNLDRGSHFIIELDPRTLPSGYRVTSENPRVLRLTRGKFGQVAFGAAVHRVVRLDLADAAFEPGGVALRPHWAGELDTLFERLREAPSVLRVAYLGDLESGALAAARLAAVVAEIEARWRAEGCCYRLLVETETYWRRGRPLQ
ncbi:MAG: hypothetical protein KatS3mg121_0376 [Gammaproteobacteria bacterium]|nr:MAG: hypothetical protein KatS3mg121_0376 [Gammaproteobacteria bacterium]